MAKKKWLSHNDNLTLPERRCKFLCTLTDLCLLSDEILSSSVVKEPQNSSEDEKKEIDVESPLCLQNLDTQI